MQQSQAQPVNLTMENGDNTDYLTQLRGSDQYAQPTQRIRASLPIPDSPAFEPTSGSKMEAESRSSIDDLMAKLAAQRDSYREQDRNQQWMNFFGKLASSKSNTLLGGLGEASNSLAETAGKQQANNQALDQAELQDRLKYAEWQREQARQEQALKQTGEYQQGELGLKRQELALGKFQPVKDIFGNVTGIFDARAGKMMPMPNATATGDTAVIDTEPSADPQQAAQQILSEQGTPLTPVGSRQDITGRNQQAKAYRDAANGAKAAIQQLDQLNAQTGKYTPGKVAGMGYGTEAALGIPSEGASARTEADKASKNLANAFMAQNVGAKGAGIRMVEFDAGAVPNADMPDEARNNLISVNKNIANSQVQRAVISDMYPRLHLSNVNTIMDAYEQANPPILPVKNADGQPLPNPNWMPYKEWLKAGRPNTAAMTLQAGSASPSVSPSISSNNAPDYSHLWSQ